MNERNELAGLLSQELGQKPQYIENVIRLLDEGNTIPFIARYRKELHGAMDDTTLRTLEQRLEYLRGLNQRREAISAAIEAQGKLTPALQQAIAAAKTLSELEDLYRPYKQKRRTRATVAREKGLAPLAEILFAQSPDGPAPDAAAQAYLSQEVETVQDALQGARDIIAETISDDAELRKTLRALMQREALLVSKAATEEDSVYRLYYDFSANVSRLQGHQVLAINRGEKEKILKVSVAMDRCSPCGAPLWSLVPRLWPLSARPPRMPMTGCCFRLWNGKSAAPSLTRPARVPLASSP